MKEVGGLGVFEATLSTLGDRCAERAGYDNLWCVMLVNAKRNSGYLVLNDLDVKSVDEHPCMARSFECTYIVGMFL